jgi:hypothetical protein
MAATSKNQRRGQKTQKHLCFCGGEVKMNTIWENRKMRHYAKCEKCGLENRKPSLMK